MHRTFHLHHTKRENRIDFAKNKTIKTFKLGMNREKKYSIEKDRLIIALTGSVGSGCSWLANDFLGKEEKFRGENFRVFSIKKEILAVEAQKKGIDLTKGKRSKRKKLQDVGNKLRKEDIHDGNSGGILIREAIAILEREKCKNPIIIYSIKNPLEVEELKKYSNAYLIAMDTTLPIRWNRIKEKQYKNDYRQFLRDDERDKDESLTISVGERMYYYGQQVQKCVDLADIVIDNDMDFNDSEDKKDKLKNKIRQHLNVIHKPGYRNPKNMELLMNNAYCTSLQSRCLKRQVGAIIIKEENDSKDQVGGYYLISAGCNNVPEGQSDCSKEYKTCYRDKKKAELFERIRHCPNCGQKLREGKCSNKKCDYSKTKSDVRDSFLLGKALDLCRALHAEENAILQISYLGGFPLKDAILYTTTFPCLLCAKKILANGIKEVVYVEPYPVEEARQMLESAGVKLTKFEGVKAQAFYKLFKDYH
jgi:deoxycytidylate deaminase